MFGLILTLAIQRRELADQREALQQQQASLEQQAAELLASRKELTKTSEAAIRAAHVELLKLSIDHPHLASVWPGGEDQPAEERQKRLFANLIISHQQTLYELELMNDERLHAAFVHLFSSPVIRDLWAQSRALRRATAAGRPAVASFVEHVDAAFEYVQAAESSARGQAEPFAEGQAESSAEDLAEASLRDPMEPAAQGPAGPEGQVDHVSSVGPPPEPPPEPPSDPGSDAGVPGPQP